MTSKVIKCPHCGAEYLPAEIFMSEDFLETVYRVDKDSKGIILHELSDEACLEEEFDCYYCNKKFIAKASVNYITEAVDAFEEETIIKIS